MDSSFMSDMVGVFLDEVEEQLGTIDHEILRLEQEGPSAETIQSLFRAAHTLKGSSAAMGFEEMKELTHEMEHVLDQVRNNELEVTEDLINVLFKCLDHLRLLKEEFEARIGTEAQGPYETDIASVIAELHRFGNGDKPAPAKTSGSAAARKTAPDSRKAEGASRSGETDDGLLSKVRQARADGFHVYEITVSLAENSPMKSARALIIRNQLEPFGAVLRMTPDIQELGGEEAEKNTTYRYLLASKKDIAELESFAQGMTDVVEAKAAEADLSAPGTPPAAAENQSAERQKTADRASDSARTAAAAKKTQTIRVDVERLETLMNLVGELVIDQTRIRRVSDMLGHTYSDDRLVKELSEISDHIHRVISDLQERVMKVRMLPIEQLFSRYPRMIRDLSRASGKEIELIIEGQETELDRSVIEEISDPLIHIIRNAVDHGLEPPEERKQKGKPAKGLLQIAAAHEGNQVVITIADDGRGIDPEKVKASAIRKGIITEEESERLSEQEAIELIFRPGFSTAAQVTDVSGRGVGMDIVRSHIEKLNGMIDIETSVGEGTRFIIKLPLTLAIIPGLLLKLADETFILPLSSVLEIVQVPTDAVQHVTGDPVVNIRGQAVPVVWPHDYLELPRQDENRADLTLVIAGSVQKRIALVVDELIGNQEVVVKSMGSYVGKIGGLAGATILGDGSVAIILEVNGLAHQT